MDASEETLYFQLTLGLKGLIIVMFVQKLCNGPAFNLAQVRYVKSFLRTWVIYQRVSMGLTD